MAFTGEAVRQGTANRFGVGSIGSTPRAFVSFRGEPYVIARDGLIHITDIENGSGVLIQNNADYNLSGADPTCAFEYNSRLYFLDRGDDILAIFDDPLNGDVSFVEYYTGIQSPAGAASDGTTVWIYDSTFDALHTINPATAATALLGTVGFDVTTPANNIGGMFYHDGSLYLLDNGTELMFVIDDPSAATLEATAVDVAIVEFGVSQRGVNGGGVHLGEAYMAGGNPDALYRFYNVRWDETIDAVEVNAGGNGSLDLSTVSKDAMSFEFTSGYTAPSWLTISGMELVITNAPAVTADTDYEPEVRAVRGSKHEDETLTVQVLAEAVPPMVTTPGAPRSLSLTKTHNRIVATWAAADDNGGEAPIRYDVRINNGNWIDTGLDLTHTFENLSAETEYTIDVAEVNSAGRGTVASASVMTDAAPVVITAPGPPRSLVFTESHNFIAVTWVAASDNGGENPIRYDVRIDGGAWIDTGLNLFYVFNSLLPETEYLIEVVQVNSAGRGTIASERVRTDAAPVVITAPSAPQNFRVTDTHPTSVDVAWDASANNGGADIQSYQGRYHEGATIPANTPWIAFTTNDSTTATLSSLKKGTQYAVEVRAVNSQRAGESSGIIIFTTDATAPDAPTGLNADTISIRSVEISWKDGENGGSLITGHQYRIQEGDTAGGTWEDTDSADTTHEISNLKPSTQYTVDVRTLNDEGESLPSNAVTFTTQVYVPTPPVWQSGNALKRTINAGESATVDIGALVPNADTVEEIFGLQFYWMDYNEATKMLELKDAPIIREDTEIKISFVAENADGKTPADYIITLNGSVLASLHNTLFFSEPLNYEPGRVQRHNSSTIVTELTDNDKTTFSTHTDFDIDMTDADGNPTAFDYVGIIAKGSNLRISITPTGGVGTGFANRFVPQTIKNIGGGEVSTVVNGLLYNLYPLPQRVTATNVRLRLNGANIEIYAVMLLKLGYELDANSDFIEMEFDRVDRTGQLPETPDGTIERAQVLGAEPFKFEAQYTIIMDGSDVDEWMDWTEANVNCAFAREFSRHPQDMFLAFFSALEMPNGYLGLVKSIGETVEFGIAEQ